MCQTFLKDKPYEFVPLLERCEREESSNHGETENGTYNGKLKLKITVLSPLHIGGKQQDYDSYGNVLKKQTRRNKIAVIPGSSLKGAVRSIAEAVSYSCSVKVPYDKLEKALPSSNRTFCSGNKLCAVCSIFGMAGKSRSYKGKVNFGEFTLVSGGTKEIDIPKLESPFKNYPKSHDVFRVGDKKINYGNERLYYCKACETGDCQNCRKEDFFQCIEAAGTGRKMEFRGRKFYSTDRENQEKSEKKSRYEMIEPGGVLVGELLFHNLREEEGKLLSYALDIGRHFTMKLGYGKPLGYGKVRIDLEGIENIGDRYQCLAGKKMTKDIFENWGQEYRMSCPDDVRKVLDEFERIMK